MVDHPTPHAPDPSPSPVPSTPKPTPPPHPTPLPGDDDPRTGDPPEEDLPLAFEDAWHRWNRLSMRIEAIVVVEPAIADDVIDTLDLALECALAALRTR